MNFDIGFQRAVLRLMLRDENFGHVCAKHLEPGFFQSEGLGWIFKLYQEYLKEYQVKPSEIVVRTMLRRLPMEKMSTYGIEVESVLSMELQEVEYIKRELQEFVRMNLFVEAHRQSAARFTAGDHVAAYRLMQDATERMREIVFEKKERQWFFEEFPDRQVRRLYDQTDPTRMPRMTGINDLDRLTGGGVQDGEMWCVFAYAKRCKTTFLTNQGFLSTRVHRMPTLHIQLEGSAKRQADKYEALFSRELYVRVKHGDIPPEVHRELLEEYRKLRRLLVVRTFNEWDVTVEAIVNELNELKSQGFEPRTLIVDYVDLLRSRSRDASGELQHQTDATRDLKRLVNQRELGCWSAWQAQRPKPGALQREHVLTSSNVAEAYAKVRIVDSYGSLNATDEEMERGEMRVYWEGHRDAAVGKLYRITNELDTMRMVTTSEEIPFEVKDAS